MLRAAALVTLLLPSTALATSVLALSEADLVSQADTIVLGSVIQVESYVTQNSTIRTRAQLQVHYALRGAREGDVVTVDVPGGRYRGIAMVTAGAPSFAPGQLVLAFLVTRGTARRPLGLAYGVYDVSLDATGVWRAQRDLSGLALLTKAGQKLVPQMQPGGEDLNVLLPRLSDHLRALGGGLK